MAQSLLVHTGNLNASIWRGASWKPNQSTEEEFCNSITQTVSGVSSETLPAEGLAAVRHPSAVQTIVEAERPSLSITVKVFLNAMHPQSLKDAVGNVLSELKVSTIDTLLLSLPLPDDEAISKDTVYPLWQAAEEMHKAGVVTSLGIADFDMNNLKLLCSWAEIQPSIDQVNLASCCVIPENLLEFAKSKDVKLLTHPDPKVLLAPGAISTCIRTPAANDGACFQPSWVARYSTIISCRGVVQHKGYVAMFQRTTCASNGTNGCH